jgi:hypothetical protein
MIEQDFVFSRIGMALVSAQRVEFITNQLIDHLREFDKDIYGLTGQEFLDSSQKSNLARITLGGIFKILKLNPKLVVEDELDEYLGKRNILIHGFWRNYLNTISEEQAKRAIDFCNDFGRHSERIESFFKGFMFFLVLRHVKDRNTVTGEAKKWEKDFDYFIASLLEKQLKGKSK